MMLAALKGSASGLTPLEFQFTGVAEVKCAAPMESQMDTRGWGSLFEKTKGLISTRFLQGTFPTPEAVRAAARCTRDEEISG